MLSVVIPILNEEAFLLSHRDYYIELCRKLPVIFVDGGSCDRSAAVAKRLGGTVIISKEGRAHQKNIGASKSDSRYLLFLHIDTMINIKHFDHIFYEIKQNTPLACFTMEIDRDDFIYSLYSWTINWRARIFGVLDGDLGLLIRRDIFNYVGGFGQFPIMEDILIGKKLKKTSKVKMINTPICVSSRKWKEDGFIKTIGSYMWAYLQLWSGFLKFKYA